MVPTPELRRPGHRSQEGGRRGLQRDAVALEEAVHPHHHWEAGEPFREELVCGWAATAAAEAEGEVEEVEEVEEVVQCVLEEELLHPHHQTS